MIEFMSSSLKLSFDLHPCDCRMWQFLPSKKTLSIGFRQGLEKVQLSSSNSFHSSAFHVSFFLLDFLLEFFPLFNSFASFGQYTPLARPFA